MFHRIYAIYIGKEMSRTEIVMAAMEERYATILEKNLVWFGTNGSRSGDCLAEKFFILEYEEKTIINKEFQAPWNDEMLLMVIKKGGG